MGPNVPELALSTREHHVLSSMTCTCRRLGIDVQLYLTQLIANMPVLNQNELDLWLSDV